MSTFGLYVWNFRTPINEPFLWPQQDFIVTVPVGRLNERGDGCNRHSTCVASITEVTAAPGHPIDFPFIGMARMAICNIAPRDDGFVDLWCHVDWHEQLNLRINMAIFNR